MSTSSPLRIAIAGASGRMGRMLIEAVLQSPDCELAGALDIPSSPALGLDAGASMGRNTGVIITSDVAAGLAKAQVLIDFTRPEGTLAHLRACLPLGVKMVIGTTGFSEAEKTELAQAAGALKNGQISPPVKVTNGWVVLLRAARDAGLRTNLELVSLDADRLRELEPHTAGIAAIHVPEAGIVDYKQVCARLAMRGTRRILCWWPKPCVRHE